MKRFYRLTHRLLGGPPDIVELDDASVKKYEGDYAVERVVVMTQEEYESTIMDVRLYEFKRGWDAAMESEGQDE